MSNNMSAAKPHIPTMMRAAAPETFGEPDVIKIKQVQVPNLLDGEVLIKIAAAGINRPDVLQRSGKYAPAEGITDILGLECSGEIVALGNNTSRYKIGDKVCALLSGGGYADYVNVPEGQCLPIPHGLDLQQAATLPECVFTVWANLFGAGQLKENKSVLIHGGSSGVGTYAIQMAVATGAKVIVTVGSEDKAEACMKLGAALAINYRRADFVNSVMEFTQDNGVNIILDMIGADYVPRNLNCIAYRGRHISIATQHGQMVAISIRDIMKRRIVLTGSTLRYRTIVEKSQLASEVETHIWPMIAAGTVKPVIYQSFPLEKAAEAHKVMESGEHIGKIVLTM